MRDQPVRQQDRDRLGGRKSRQDGDLLGDCPLDEALRPEEAGAFAIGLEPVSTETAGSQNQAVVGGCLEGCYIGGFPFMVGLGTAPGPVSGGRLFLRLRQAAWPVVRAGAVLAGVAAVVAVRAHRGKGRLRWRFHLSWGYSYGGERAGGRGST